MWYPTLSDVVDLHERVAYSRGHALEVADPEALDRVVVAPQWAGRDASSDRRLARKAAALFLTATRLRPFQESNVRTAFAVMLTFLHRNGTRLEVSFDAVRDRFDEVGFDTLDEGTLAAFLVSNCARRSPSRPLRRLLAALSRLAHTIEALDEEPALEDQVSVLDGVGADISHALAVIFVVNPTDWDTLSPAYPAVGDRWAEAFSDGA